MLDVLGGHRAARGLAHDRGRGGRSSISDGELLAKPCGIRLLAHKGGPCCSLASVFDFLGTSWARGAACISVIENGPFSAGRRAEKKRRRAAEVVVSCPGRLMSTTRASTTCEMVFVHEVPLFLRVLVVEARPWCEQEQQKCRPRELICQPMGWPS